MYIGLKAIITDPIFLQQSFFFFQPKTQCRYLVQYSKEARISSDALTKHSPGLNIGLDVDLKQSEVVQEQFDVPSQLSWKQKLQYYLRLSKIRLTGQWITTYVKCTCTSKHKLV